jgi:hypothetical protein
MTADPKSGTLKDLMFKEFKHGNSTKMENKLDLALLRTSYVSN